LKSREKEEKKGKRTPQFTLFKHIDLRKEADTTALTLHRTTSFLTATILVYATGAGITAAAGTRLALQLLLSTVFT